MVNITGLLYYIDNIVNSRSKLSTTEVLVHEIRTATDMNANKEMGETNQIL
jgi:hypothetical protein